MCVVKNYFFVLSMIVFLLFNQAELPAQFELDQPILKELSPGEVPYPDYVLEKQGRMINTPVISELRVFDSRVLLGLNTLDGLRLSFPGLLNGTVYQSKELSRKSKYEVTWSAKISGGDILLSVDNGRVYGQIRLEDQVYDIQYHSPGLSTLVKYDMAEVSEASCKVIDRDKPASWLEHIKNSSWEETPNFGSVDPVVRVLVVYTQAAENTGLDMVSVANTAQTQWLAAQNNSNVYTQLEIAAVVETDFVEYQGSELPNQANVDVNRLISHVPIQQLRNQYEADVVILLTNGNYGNIAGIAPIAASDATAYGIVQAVDATAHFTFIHELGHILGADHEFEELQIPGENHGYAWDTDPRGLIYKTRRRYSSIMRTYEGIRTRVLHFSNPHINHASKPTGEVGVAFNANVINQGGQVVCDYRINPPNVAIYGPADAESGDVVSFLSGVNQGNAPYHYQWEVNSGTGFYHAGNLTFLDVTMPPNDLEVKLTVTDANGRVNSDTHFVMNTFYGGGCVICPDRIGEDRFESKTVQTCWSTPILLQTR